MSGICLWNVMVSQRPPCNKSHLSGLYHSQQSSWLWQLIWDQLSWNLLALDSFCKHYITRTLKRSYCCSNLEENPFKIGSHPLELQSAPCIIDRELTLTSTYIIGNWKNSHPENGQDGASHSQTSLCICILRKVW